MSRLRIAADRVDDILLRLAKPVSDYCWIQSRVNVCNLQQDTDFQRRFNGFYRIIKKPRDWYDTYYSYFETAKRARPNFDEALGYIHKHTGRVEASFVSKLIATIDTEAPIIDKYILEYFGLRLPSLNVENRIHAVSKIYTTLLKEYGDVLKDTEAQIICEKFDERFPASGISTIKKVDFVLWQIRD